MATMLLVHAHPDDEAISTGGVMMKARAHGHRVVLVTATRGEVGEIYNMAAWWNERGSLLSSVSTIPESR